MYHCIVCTYGDGQYQTASLYWHQTNCIPRLKRGKDQGPFKLMHPHDVINILYFRMLKPRLLPSRINIPRIYSQTLNKLQENVSCQKFIVYDQENDIIQIFCIWDVVTDKDKFQQTPGL